MKELIEMFKEDPLTAMIDAISMFAAFSTCVLVCIALALIF